MLLNIQEVKTSGQMAKKSNSGRSWASAATCAGGNLENAPNVLMKLNQTALISFSRNG
jgi:hypothetical protein